MLALAVPTAHLERLHSLLEKLAEERRAELPRLKDRGIPIVGYFCNYTPRELIEACGAIPIRLADGGSYESRNLGEKLVRSDACPFCKSCLGLFEQDPVYRAVTVVVVSSLCDQMRRLAEVIQKEFRIPVLQMGVSRTSADDSTRRLYHHEVDWLRHELEHLTGRCLTGEVLAQAMLDEEEKRSLLRAIDEVRAQDNPPVAETDILRLVSSTNFLSVEDCSALLRHELISLGIHTGNRTRNTKTPGSPSKESECIPGSGSSCLGALVLRSPGRSARPRLLLAGSIVAEHDLELVQMIEKRADIVSDLLCSGVRTFLEPLVVPVSDDVDVQLSALADHYFDQPGCIQRRPNTGYYELARRLVQRYRVDAVVLKTLLFCDAYNYEAIRFQQEVGLPLLHVDTDYGERNREQILTRIEAFLETLATDDSGPQGLHASKAFA